MKRLILTLALGVCSAFAQTPQYLPANGCTTQQPGQLNCPTINPGVILPPTQPTQTLANLGASSAGNLVAWNNAIANLERAGSPSQVSVAWVGDSYAVNETITTPFRTALQTQFGVGGYGWVDLYYLSSVQPGIAVGAAGTWTPQRQTAGSTGLNISDIRTSDTATPARVTVTVQQDTASATLFYLKQPGGGTFQWWVDAATPIVISTAAASTSIGTSTITGLSNSSAHTFQVQITAAGSAGICIEGMDLRSVNPGVVVHNLGSAGSDTGNWVAVNAGLWESQLAAVTPSLVVIMLSPNDQADSITVLQQYTNLSNLITRIRAAVPGVSILLAAPPDNGLGRSPTMSAYAGSQNTLAAAVGVGFINTLQGVNSAALVDTGSGAFNPLWFNNDLLHPNVPGGQVISNVILQGLTLPVVTGPLTYDSAGNPILAYPSMFVGDSSGTNGYGSLRVRSKTNAAGSSMVFYDNSPSVLPWKIDMNDTCGANSVGIVRATAAATNSAPPTWGTPVVCIKNDGTMSITKLRTGTASNTDVAGQLTLSAGSATYTFAGTYTSAPICTANDATAAAAVKASATTTVLTVTGTGTDVVNYQCVGRN